MQWKTLGEKLKRFRYPALVLLLGIALMLVPIGKKTTGQSKSQTAQETVPQTVTDYKTQTEQQLATILRQVNGAGSVSVMLSLKSGEQTIYQTDSALVSQTADGTTSNSASETTVVLSRDDVGQEAVVAKVLTPTFLGAVVVCQGADDPQVRLSVIQVVASATGLSSEKITVVKMK